MSRGVGKGAQPSRHTRRQARDLPPGARDGDTSLGVSRGLSPPALLAARPETCPPAQGMGKGGSALPPHSPPGP